MDLPDTDELLDWLRSRKWGLLLALVLAGGGLNWYLDRPLHPPPGVLAPEEPLQGQPTKGAWDYRDHHFVSLASFDIHARVLSRERYRFDRAAELSPLDLALGWGRMSDSAVLDLLKIRQDGRWYYWSAAAFPIPPSEIISHSANMHMIPADAYVKRRLLELREGQVIHLAGQLVRAEGKDHWIWVSSLSRQDAGDGACEVIWVESVGPG